MKHEYKRRKGESVEDARRRYMREYMRQHPQFLTPEQKDHRNEKTKEWRQEHPNYHKEYMRKYNLKRKK